VGEVYFDLSFKKEDDILMVQIRGRLVFPEADSAERMILHEISRNKCNAVFDFSDCKFIASSGYAIFIRIKKECDEQKLKIAFTNCTETVKGGFFAIGYQTIVKFFDTIEQAKEYVKQ